LENGPLHEKLALKMVKDVAKGLQAMHENGVVHGNLGLNSILIAPDGSARLRRDPFFPPGSPYSGAVPSLIQQNHSSLATAAPELSMVGSQCSVRTDLYALGCLWYRSLTGQWPVEPATNAPPKTWASLHATIPIQVPEALPEPLGKCLRHLLAKDPAARFPSAKAFLEALRSSAQPMTSAQQTAVTETPTISPVVREPTVDYATPSKPEPEPEKLAAEIRDKKSKLALRYHNRPFGSKVPNNIAAPIDVPAAEEPKEAQTSSEAKQVDAPKLDKVPEPKMAREPPVVTVGPSVDLTLRSHHSEPTSPSEKPDKAEMLKTPERPSKPEKPASPKVKKPKSTKRSKATGTTKTKGKSKKKTRPVWVMPVMIVGSCCLLGLLAFLLRGQSRGIVTIANTPNKSSSNHTPSPSNANQPANPVVQRVIDPMAEKYDVRPDDGKLPWAPPSAGTPYSLDLLPMGVEAMVFMSPRSWQHHGPVAPLVAWWESVQPESQQPWWRGIAIPSEGVEHITVAWYPGAEPSTSRYVVRVTMQVAKRLSDWISIEEWSAKPLTVNAAGSRGSVWIRKGDSAPNAMVCDGLGGTADSMTRTLTWGPAELLETLSETNGAASPLRRQLEMLRQASDASADLTLLVAPSFLYGDGKEILGADSPRILGYLRNVIDDKVQAFMLRTHWDPYWYVEWRSLGNDLQAASRNAASIKLMIESLSDQLEAALVTQPADPYWRAIANRFPQMLRALSRYTRTAAEDGQVVVNAYLPPEAISNLAIGSWMAAQRDWTMVTSVPTNPKAPASGKTIEQWLDSPISLRIEQDSLENVLQAIATEVKDSSGSPAEPLPMAINGTAFQKDGITRNQQIRNFEFSNTPVREVLTSLARRANPVTTVKSPNEKDQKIVWVVLDDPATASKKKLELTTRAWAESNNATLPKEFVLASQ
jgi:serine/threonine protein kinase